jgi:hypothetical protein
VDDSDWLLPWPLGRLLSSSSPASCAGHYPSTLQELEVPVISSEACEQLYNPIGVFLPDLERVIKEDMFCAGERQSRKDSCKVSVGSWGISTHLLPDLNVDLKLFYL